MQKYGRYGGPDECIDDENARFYLDQANVSRQQLLSMSLLSLTPSLTLSALTSSLTLLPCSLLWFCSHWLHPARCYCSTASMFTPCPLTVFALINWPHSQLLLILHWFISFVCAHNHVARFVKLSTLHQWPRLVDGWPVLARLNMIEVLHPSFPSTPLLCEELYNYSNCFQNVTQF